MVQFVASTQTIFHSDVFSSPRVLLKAIWYEAGKVPAGN